MLILNTELIFEGLWRWRLVYGKFAYAYSMITTEREGGGGGGDRTTHQTRSYQGLLFY